MVKEKTEYDKIFQLDKGADTGVGIWPNLILTPDLTQLILASHPDSAGAKAGSVRLKPKSKP